MVEKVYGKLSKFQIDTVRVRGLLIEERIALEYEQCKQNRLSSKVWEDILDAYGLNSSMLDHVVLESVGDGAISDKLLTVLESAVTKNNKVRDIEPLCLFLKYENALSGTELLGTVKAIEQAKHVGRGNQHNMFLHIMRHVAFHKLASTCKVVIDAAKPLFDEAVLSQFSMMRAKGVSWQAYVNTRKDILSLLMESDDVEAVMQQRDDVINVAPQISRLTASSLSGQAIFAVIRDTLASTAMATQLKTILAQVLAADFSDVSLKMYRAVCNEKKNKMNKGNVASKRGIMVNIAEMTGKLIIASAEAEGEMKLACAIKTAALGAPSGLPLLPCEEILGARASTDPCKVPSELLTGMVAARENLLTFFQRRSPRNFADVQRVFDDFFDSGEALDPSLKIERAILAELGPQLNKKMRDSVLEILPSSTRTSTLSQASAELTALTKGQLYAFCSLSGQRSLEGVIEIINNLMIAVPPELPASGADDFYTKVGNAITFFITHKPANGEPSPFMSGMPALEALWTELDNRMADGTDKSVRLSDVGVFQTFKHLLSADRKKTLSDWVRKILAGGGAADALSVGSSSGGGGGGVGSVARSTGSAKRKTEKKTLTKASLLKFFKT
eukprot:TRINITY_DN75599_c0_g1_i1.p1 TRINITY_DN75599_c0_g1~~TRINITY_DN75599_c0_g1_i1.p1  ORF type:complete len:672 (-),score=153.00 TRINITY_DN75599_c0_g1_i1:131-1978(-)